MKMFGALLISAALVVGATGCTSLASGKKYSEYSAQPSTNEATVIIFRPDTFTGRADTVSIVADKIDQGKVQPAGFLAFSVPEKKVLLHTDTAGIDHPVEIDAKAGSTYYFRAKFTTYYVTGGWSLIPTSDLVAASSMRDLRESKGKSN